MFTLNRGERQVREAAAAVLMAWKGHCGVDSLAGPAYAPMRIDMAELGPFRILVDGQCPVCRREGEFLRWLDRGRGRVVVEDITSSRFDPDVYGLSHDEVMKEIHGITWDGRVLRGMAVFREVYTRLGLGFVTAPTGWPVLRPLADKAYQWFARNRIRLLGQGHRCEAGVCGRRFD